MGKTKGFWVIFLRALHTLFNWVIWEHNQHQQNDFFQKISNLNHPLAREVSAPAATASLPTTYTPHPKISQVIFTEALVVLWQTNKFEHKLFPHMTWT